jgi:hypothetical protein
MMQAIRTALTIVYAGAVLAAVYLVVLAAVAVVLVLFDIVVVRDATPVLWLRDNVFAAI